TCRSRRSARWCSAGSRRKTSHPSRSRFRPAGKNPSGPRSSKGGVGRARQSQGGGGFSRPGGGPPPRGGSPGARLRATTRRGRAKPGVRLASDTQRAVVLEERGEAKRRPAAVCGAVLVEAVPFPSKTVPGQPSALLQVWPEPRLRWEGLTTTKLAKASDELGA